MKRILLACIFSLISSVAFAQATATVISACGTPLSVLSLGQSFPLMMDTTGKLCDSGSGSNVNASVGATGAAVPASATYIGASVSGTLTGLTATASGLQVDGSGVTQPVSISSVPLPTGAATSALQTTGNTSLATIATNTGAAIPAGTNLIGAAAPFGTATMATGQVSCGLTDTTIVAARTGAAGTGRASVTLTNITGTQQIEIGNTGVATNTGIALPAVVGASITLNTTAAIHCITVTGAQTITYVETY